MVLSLSTNYASFLFFPSLSSEAFAALARCRRAQWSLRALIDHLDVYGMIYRTLFYSLSRIDISMPDTGLACFV